MARASTAERLDGAFRALADASRRAMIDRLSRGPASVSELGEPLDMTMAAVVKHLNVLQSHGFVRSEKLGRVRTFRLLENPLTLIEHWVAQRRRRLVKDFDALEKLLGD